MHSSKRSQQTNEVLSDFSNVWKSVDKLKAGLARAENQLAQAGKQDLEDNSHVPERTDEMLKTDKKPTRKVCKIGKAVKQTEPLTESDDEVSGTIFRAKRKRLKRGEIKCDSDWNAVFRNKQNIDGDDSDLGINCRDDIESLPTPISSNSKVRYLNEEIPLNSRVLRRPNTAPETSRLSAGYDPSEQTNKFLDRSSQNSKDFKVHKVGKMNQKAELETNKSSPRKRSFGKEQKVGSWNESRKADGLQKLEELVEKQQAKLIKRAKSVPDAKVSSKPPKPIIPISISSQNTMTTNQRLEAPAIRKLAAAPPIAPYPGFSDPRRLELHNLSVVKGRKSKIDKTSISEKKIDGRNRKGVTKKIAKITGNIEDYIICPTSWRKGQELVLKELGPFKLASEHEKSVKNENTIDAESGAGLLPVHDVESESENRSIANHLDSGKDGNESEELTQSKDKFGENTEMSITESSSESMTITKSANDRHKRTNLNLGLKRKPKNTETEQPQIPKIRHYNPDDVRNYMQKQKKERLQQLTSEKQRKQQEKKEREQKLQDLQRLQKKLAKAAIPKQAESKKDVEVNDCEKDELSEPLNNASMHDCNTDCQPEIANNVDDAEKLSTLSDLENSQSHSAQADDPAVIISDMSKNEPVKQEFREISPEEIYKKIQDFDNILASMTLIQDPKPLNSVGKLERIHATAVSLQQQIDDETNRITQILHHNNNDVRLDAFYQQPLTVAGEGNNSASPMPSYGQGEASRSSGETSAFSTSPFQTRHERIVRSKSQFSVFDGNLPGVTNLIRHAQSVASYQVREVAARKIQAAYRGFKVRKCLKWRLLHNDEANDVNVRERDGSELGHSSSLSEGSLTDDPDIDFGANLLTTEFCGKQKISYQSINLPSFTKPDPYNFINTLHRTLRQVNASPVPTQSRANELERRVNESKEVKDVTSIYSDDFEQNSDIQDPKLQSVGAGADELTSKSLPITVSQAQPSMSASLGTNFGSASGEETLSEGSLSSEFEDSQKELSLALPALGNTAQDSSVSKSELARIRDDEKDSSVANYYKKEELKYSPNCLKFKMSNELMYLESVEESLRQIDHMERIQGVGLAQQETVTLAQALQNERQKRVDEMESFKSVVQQEVSDREKQLAESHKHHQAALTAAIESVNIVRSEAAAAINSTTTKLLNTQAEAAKMTADAAKQLAEAGAGFTRDVGEISKGTATSAAIAAVTSVLKELQKNSSRKDLLSDNSCTHDDQDDQVSFSKNETTSEEVRSRETNSRNPSIYLQSTPSGSSSNQATGISEHIGTISRKSIPEETIKTKSGLTAVSLSGGSISEELNEERSFSYSTQFEDTNSEREVERKITSTDKRSEKRVFKDENPKIGSISVSAENISDKTSFNNFTLEMVKQYMKKEEMRAKHEMALLKLREKSLIEKTKAEVAWLELQKQQHRDKGEDDKMPPLRKRQRWLMLRLQQEQAEIRRLREAQLVASQERQMLLEQQQQITQLRQSTRQILGRIREISPGMLIPSLKSLPNSSRSVDVSPKSSLRLQVLSSSDTVPTDEEMNNVATDTQSDIGEVVSDIQTPASRDSKSDSELQHEVSDSSYKSSLAGRVLKGLKTLERNKRKLTLREQKLLEKRKDVESLLAWRKQLEVGEQKVKAMEEKVKNKMSNNVPLDINLNDGIPEEIVSKGSLDVLEESKLEEGTLGSTVIEEVSCLEATKTEQVKTKSGGTGAKMESSVDYGNSFESSASQPKSISSEKQVPVPSVSLRLPLSPRTRSKKRDSSGSEDSITVSQSETASDLSDIEGRVHALKEELRRRKFEADRLRKEQKRRNKERLKAQEASLLKQIEAYDRFISQAKTELDHELEVDPQVKVTKPQIRQPKVAESRHLAKIQNLSSIHGWSEGAGDEFVNSPKNTPRDDTIASSLSELTMNESNKSSSLEEDKSSNLMESAKQKENDVDAKTTESEASSSDAVKTVTEKSEDLIQIQSDKGVVEAPEQSQVLSQPEIKISQKDDEITKVESVKAPERSPSDDETIAEEIVDEEVEVVEDGFASEATRVPRDDKIEIVGHSSPIPQNTEEQVGNENCSEQASPVIHTSSASSSSTFQDRKKKIDNVIKEKIEALISSLLQKELDDAVDEVGDRLKKRKKSVESNVFCGEMTENLLNELYQSSVELVLGVFKRRRRPASPINVGQRVRAIMTELEQKSTTSSPQERPSLSEILSLSSPSAYNDVLTSPEGSASLSESPARAEGLESPLSRPLSPVLSYPSDRFQALSDKLTDSDLQSDQDWFEDDLDVTNNYYQIYPYKQSYIIREIPNKAPPPYTQPLQGIASTSDFTMPPNLFSNQNDSFAEDTNQYVASHTEAEIQTLVARATTLVHDYLSRGESTITPPNNYFVIQATDDENRIVDGGQSAFRRFIFDLTKEIVTEAHFAAREPPRPPWMKPKWMSQRKPGPTSRSSSDLISFVQKQVFGFVKGSANSVGDSVNMGRKSSSVSVISKKKQDRVDEILVKELREEELDWVTYEVDEVSVKMKAADTILSCLISETAQVMYSVHARLRGPQR